MSSNCYSDGMGWDGMGERVMGKAKAPVQSKTREQVQAVLGLRRGSRSSRHLPAYRKGTRRALREAAMKSYRI